MSRLITTTATIPIAMPTPIPAFALVDRVELFGFASDSFEAAGDEVTATVRDTDDSVARRDENNAESVTNIVFVFVEDTYVTVSNIVVRGFRVSTTSPDWVPVTTEYSLPIDGGSKVTVPMTWLEEDTATKALIMSVLVVLEGTPRFCRGNKRIFIGK